MSPSRIPRALLFDLDGVLIDSMPFHCEAWMEAFVAVGLSIEPLAIYRLEGCEPGRLVRLLYKDQTGVSPESHVVEKILAVKARRYTDTFRLRVYPGATELLRRLRGRSLRIALVTGAAAPERIPGLAGAVLEHCDAIVSGEDATGWKPDALPYLQAMRALSVSPAECLVVENSPLGVASAVNAGICCLAVLNNSPLSPHELIDAGAECVTPDIEGLTQTLLELLGEPAFSRGME